MVTKLSVPCLKKNFIVSLVVMCMATGCVTDRFDHIDTALTLSSKKSDELSKELKSQSDNLTVAYEKLKRQNELLAQQLLKSEKAIRDIEKLRVAIPADLEKRIKAEYDKSISSSEQKIKQENSEMVAGVKKDIKNVLHTLKSDIAMLARQKINGNEEAAKLSFAEAKKSLEKKDYHGARVYCLNAINHSPTNFDYFKLLVSILKENETSSVSDYEQIRNVLELGLYQIDAGHIPEMAKLIENVAASIDDLTSAIAREQAQEEQEQTKLTLNTVQSGRLSWDNVLKSSDVQLSAKARLESLNTLLSSNSISQDDLRWCKNELTKVNTLLGALISLTTVDSSLSKAQAILDKSVANKAAMTPEDLAAISSMVQTANGILGQSWNINFNLLPSKYLEQMKARAERISSIELIFNRTKSEPAIVAIAKLQKEIKKKLSESNLTYTERINATQLKMKDIVSLMSNVYDKEAHQRIEKSVMDISDELKKLVGKRYKAYQDWVIKKSEEAFEMYKQWTRVDEDDAVSVVREHLLEIDASLLTPDVAKLYQDVLSKQFAEMGWKVVAQIEIELATHTKKTLEDF